MNTAFLTRADGSRLAYCFAPPDQDRPTVVFCSGLKSDMTGSKAMHLEAWCVKRGLGFLRFDYFGHGQSDGAFTDGTIGRWKADALAVLDEVTTGDVLMAGSSLGGWISTLATEARPERVKGLLTIAAAPDFTHELMLAGFAAAQHEALEVNGYVELPSDYDDGPYVISKALIDEAAEHLVMGRHLKIVAPVRMLHGLQDADVPHTLSQRLMDKFAGDDVVLTLIKNGDHRLSEPQDLKRLSAALEDLISAAAPSVRH